MGYVKNTKKTNKSSLFLFIKIWYHFSVLVGDSMKINNEEFDINKLTENIYNDKNMLKMRGNGIYLSDNDIKILERYEINYNNYVSLGSLIFDIESILNESSDVEELEEISKKLSELNYYNNTNK